MSDEPTTQPTMPAVAPTDPNPVGRPSGYSQEIIIKGLEYVANYDKLGDVIPTIEGLAIHLGVSRKTLYNWSEDPEKVEFLHIFETCMAKQGRTLINKGLNGEFNSTVSKLMLSKHGYVEKTEIDATTKGESLNNLSPREQAKLDLLLANGTSNPTTEQGSTESSGTGESSTAPIPNE
jgi:hypothetical protein